MNVKKLIVDKCFSHCYQPIYNLGTKSVLGYEALIRSYCKRAPEELFKEAVKTKQLYELDSRSIHKAVQTYVKVGHFRKGNLFLNVLPSTVLNPRFIPFLKQIISDFSLRSQQIVLELSEWELVEDFEELSDILSIIKDSGYLLAIDDVGKGYSSFRTIVELEPDYIKLDRFLAENLQCSPKKQSVVHFFLNFSRQYGSTVILEGIENQLEEEIALKMGIPFGQGYGLCKPFFINEVII